MSEWVCVCLGQGAGISVAGKMESGYVQCYENITVVPANELVSVRGKREREGES